MECDDGSRSFVEGRRWLRRWSMGLLATRGSCSKAIGRAFREAFIVYLFPAVTARWDSSNSSVSLAIGADALGT